MPTSRTLSSQTLHPSWMSWRAHLLRSRVIEAEKSARMAALVNRQEPQVYTCGSTQRHHLQLLAKLSLVFIPAGFVVYYLNLRATTCVCYQLLGYHSQYHDGVLGRRGNRTPYRRSDRSTTEHVLQHAPQLISSILLLRSRQITVLKTSLLGSIISNLLLMLGLCMFFGGINRVEQHYNLRVAQTISMMLLLATLSLVIPTASHLMANVTQHDIVVQSRGTSVVIIFSYGLYLFFIEDTHQHLHRAVRKDTEKRSRQTQANHGAREVPH